MSTRILICIAILCLVVLPSASRTLGIYSGEVYRIQQYLGGDKISHLLIGAGLMVSFAIILSAASSTRKLATAFVLASAVLVAEECIQILIPNRHFEWVDMFWGIIGAISSVAIIIFWRLAQLILMKNK